MSYHNYNEGYQSFSACAGVAASLPVILENGRKVFGPPPNFTESRPTYKCELYITRLPQQFDEVGFLVWLHRIGRVYQFRLMMNTGNSIRGYAFVRFCNESDALAGFELLKYLFVGEDRLSVFRSQGKNRLFISGIPRHIPINVVGANFKLCFPKMQKCKIYEAFKEGKPISSHQFDENRGFAFIEYSDHEMALEAKKRLTPGRVRMWGVDLKVQWAKSKEELQQSLVRKNRPQAPGGHKIRIYPPYPFNDYCAKLRLYCLANNLSIPVVLYGPCFRQYQLQYTGILLKNNSNGLYSMYIFEIMVAGILDIHLLMCELVVKMFERQKGQLHQHALFRVPNGMGAELVATFERSQQLGSLTSQSIFKNPEAIKYIAISLELLAMQNSTHLLAIYKNSFLTPAASLAEFKLDDKNYYGHFYSILPKFRDNDKLHNHFNDIEIVLLQPNLPQALLQVSEYEMFKSFRRLPIMKNLYYKNSIMYEKFILKSQRGYGIKYILRFVDFMSLQTKYCYHPAQRVNSNPIWITGRSYQQSIYN